MNILVIYRYFISAMRKSLIKNYQKRTYYNSYEINIAID